MQFLDINQFNFHLPDSLIAKYPLEKRDDAKLLSYKNNEITHHHFHELTNLLSPKDTLVFNNAKVIPARIYLTTQNNAPIEVLLLSPVLDYFHTFNSKTHVEYICMIGNKRKWKEQEEIKCNISDGFEIIFKWENREKNIIKIIWDKKIPFIQLLEKIGKIPLPPYIKRALSEKDKETYQTVYSNQIGSVAAPTAGLHFTEQLLQKLRENNISQIYTTLHISAGTFASVKTINIFEHPMHQEVIEISKIDINEIINNKNRIAVGTTSLRILESLYWVGIKVINKIKNEYEIKKEEPYQLEKIASNITYEQSLQSIIEQKGNNKLNIKTELLIADNYKIKSIKAIITNFHQPKSTLLCLIDVITNKNWKKIYNEAISQEYRFYSYGDASIIYL